MRRAGPVVLIALGLGGCASPPPQASAPPTTAPPTTTPPPTTMPGPQVQEIAITLSDAPSNKCRVEEVNPKPRKHAWPDDVVRWDFAVKSGNCKLRRLRVKKLADVIDCSSSAVITSNVKIPLEDCDREVVSGDIDTVYRLTCSVESAAAIGCYKYSIAGVNIVNGDPEIEIEGPRATPPPTPMMSPPPPRSLPPARP